MRFMRTQKKKMAAGVCERGERDKKGKGEALNKFDAFGHKKAKVVDVTGQANGLQ